MNVLQTYDNHQNYKAEILNKAFCSIFTQEDTTSLPMPYITGNDYPDIPLIQIWSEGIC